MTAVNSRLDRATLCAIPSGIWALGFVSLFMDVSSELIHSLLPVYLVTGLGASALAVGIIEGIAEATASVTKLFSGVVSDWLRRRKLLALIGYGVAAVTKPIFPLASTVAWVAAARFIDRVGKGIRGAPRDALVADLAPAELRGAAFGLRQSLDTVGAFVGPLLAILLMSASGDDFRAVFWFAVAPAVFAVALLLWGVKEPARSAASVARFPLARAELVKLPRCYWLVILITAFFTLARFSEAFLLLRAQSAGLALAFVPGVLVVMNIVYALAAYPAGVVSDRPGGRIRVVLLGLLFLIIADALLALAPFGIWGVMLGAGLWGLHMGFTQGVLSTLVADAAPAELRGTAFGVFNLVSGLALLLASVIAGGLWSAIGHAGTFIAGGAFALASALLLIALRKAIAPSPA
jgi:MFS family permease